MKWHSRGNASKWIARRPDRMWSHMNLALLLLQQLLLLTVQWPCHTTAICFYSLHTSDGLSMFWQLCIMYRSAVCIIKHTGHHIGLGLMQPNVNAMRRTAAANVTNAKQRTSGENLQRNRILYSKLSNNRRNSLYIHCVSKTHRLWNSIAQNYKIDFDDIWQKYSKDYRI